MAILCKVVWLVAAVFLCLPVSLAAYEIGAGDVLEIEVWQQPDLTSTTLVYSDGSIILPVVGSVSVAQMTPSEAAKVISRRFSSFNPRISQVTVSVVEFRSRSLYVLGEVSSPGKYGFEEMPGLLDALSAAGGTTEEACLSSIIILGPGSGAGGTLTVDLEKAVTDGDLSALPALRPDDLIWVPRTDVFRGAERVSVLGEVANPGLYAIGSDTDLFDLILQAGGPTEEADLGRVRLMRPAQGAVTVDLYGYLERGERNLVPRLDSDDVIFLNKRSRFWSNVWNGFRETVTVVGAVAGVYLLYDQLSQE